MLKREIAFINEKGILNVKEEKMPRLKENEVQIRVETSLISPGTEMARVIERRKKACDEACEDVFGYSIAGTVVKIKGSPRGLRPGMRVAAMGTGANHANFANVPINLVVPIPKNVTFAQAPYACLGATSLQAVRRTVPQLGEFGIVLGLGIVGNLAAQEYQLSGARIIGWEGYQNRIDIAKKCGIANFANFKKDDVVKVTKKFAAPYGADFAIFAFGGKTGDSFDNVLSCMKVSQDGHQMGRMILVGGCEVTYSGGAYTGNIDVRSASRTGAGYHDSEYEYGRDYPNAFIQFTTQRNLREIVALIAEKRLLVDPLTTHTMPLAKVNDAADLLVNTPDQAMGIIMTMEH
jgi:NADPH:quinone reductase-like Zn-dependent oxidoreductase